MRLLLIIIYALAASTFLLSCSAHPDYAGSANVYLSDMWLSGGLPLIDTDKVVLDYCRMSRDGEHDKLLELIGKPSSSQSSKNINAKRGVADAPLMDEFLSDIEYKNVSTTLPKLIFDQKFDVTSIKTLEKNESYAKVNVLVTSAAVLDVQYEITFYLKREGTGWTIAKAGFIDLS